MEYVNEGKNLRVEIILYVRWCRLHQHRATHSNCFYITVHSNLYRAPWRWCLGRWWRRNKRMSCTFHFTRKRNCLWHLEADFSDWNLKSLGQKLYTITLVGRTALYWTLTFAIFISVAKRKCCNMILFYKWNRVIKMSFTLYPAG